jgi:SNF2 family DNA or RNA helicase
VGLMAHQQAMLNDCEGIFSCGDGVLLAADPGLGKTVTAISLAKQQGHEKILVVCPTSILGVWGNEMSTWWPELPVRILTGTVEDRKRELLTFSRGMAVVNYEVIQKMERSILAWRPTLVIADEAHRLKSWASKNSKSLATIADKCRSKRVALTGTPLPNGPIDAMGLFRFLDRLIFGNSIIKFRDAFCVTNPNIPQQVLRYKNLDDFERKFHSISVIVKKDAVLRDLPPKMNREIPVELPARARKMYEDLERDMVAEWPEMDADDDSEQDAADDSGKTRFVITPTVLTKLLRLSQITGGFLEGQSLHRAKLDALADRLRDHLIDPSRKVVVFARFTPEIDAIANTLDTLGYHFSVIDGRTKARERTEMIRRFQSDSTTRVILGQLQAMSEGVTLTAADTMLYYSLDYSEARRAQSEDRIHRIGQKNTCVYEYLVARATVDQDIVRALDKKRDLARMILSRRHQSIAERTAVPR